MSLSQSKSIIPSLLAFTLTRDALRGVETLASSSSSNVLPTSKIALCLLLGFSFMLVIEQFISPHSHSSSSPSIHLGRFKEDGLPDSPGFDAQLFALEQEEGLIVSGYAKPHLLTPQEPGSQKAAYPLTLGLVMHGLADGLALGASSLSKSDSEIFSDLSVVVFIALIIHKGAPGPTLHSLLSLPASQAPTALALTTSLLSSSVSRSECKRHLAYFSAATPFGAILSHLVFIFLGSQGGDWAGMALLVSVSQFTSSNSLAHLRYRGEPFCMLRLCYNQFHILRNRRRRMSRR